MFLWTGHFAYRPDEGNTLTKPVINESKLTPLQNDKFKMVAPLDKELSDGVSFVFPRKKNWYLTVKEDMFFIEQKKRATSFGEFSIFNL